MSAENEKIAAQHRLTSWKEITAYVGRDERTAKRWETTRGLPVRRVPGSRHGSVFAYADEVEAWLQGHAVPVGVQSPSLAAAEQAQRSGFGPRRFAFAAFALCAAIALTTVAYRDQWRGSPSLRVPRTTDPVAASLYRAGLHAWQTRTPSGLGRAIVEFDQAIARDPRFADAYVGLADAYNLEGEFTTTRPDSTYPRASAAARRAIALDPSFGAAHAALGFSDFYGLRDLRAADMEFRRATALDPRNPDAHHWYATFLMTIGEFDAALSEIAKAESLDAESAAIPADKALILFHAGKTAEAIRLLAQIEEDNPGFASPHRYLAAIELARGNDAAYVRELRMTALARHDNTGVALADTPAQGLARAGHGGMLRALLADQRRFFDANRVSAYSLAATCAELGDDACTKSYLAISVARRETDNISLGIDSPFWKFHKAAWFVAALAKAGLPPQTRP